jgi:hypothetical protein
MKRSRVISESSYWRGYADALLKEVLLQDLNNNTHQDHTPEERAVIIRHRLEKILINHDLGLHWMFILLGESND